jgi:hypothetical protein
VGCRLLPRDPVGRLSIAQGSSASRGIPPSVLPSQLERRLLVVAHFSFRRKSGRALGRANGSVRGVNEKRVVPTAIAVL